MARKKDAEVIEAKSVEVVNEVNTEAIAKVTEQIDEMVRISEQLEQLREEASLIARRRDIEHVQKLDSIMETVLSAITENQDVLKGEISKMIARGDFKRLKELMVVIGIAVDKREMLLGYDESRQQTKKKLKLQVVWKGADGSSGGVQIEQ